MSPYRAADFHLAAVFTVEGTYNPPLSFPLSPETAAPLAPSSQGAGAGGAACRGSRAMSFRLDRIHVWSGEVADQAGGVASKLAMLAQAGTHLEYIYTRRQPDKPGTGILYVAPVSAALQQRAARPAGLVE